MSGSSRTGEWPSDPGGSGKCAADSHPGKQGRWWLITRDGIGEKFSRTKGRERRLD